MSLIELALSKLRNPGASQVSTPRRAVLDAPASKAAEEPQFLVTPQMRDHLGIGDAGVFEHQRAAEFRHIKRQIVAEIQANPASRVVVVASAMSGEGKSFTAANLANSLSLEHDYNVVLVDADAVKPYLTRSLQMTDRPGLMDALANPSLDVESMIVRTDLNGLRVLPAGSASAQATEYFASGRMRQVLDRLLEVPNRIVLIDALPLLLTTEARALMPLAHQVLVVVRAETTPQAAVKEALGLIGPGRKVKLVLNAVVRTKLSRYLGYSYGFEYNYSSSDKKRDTK
ncbi:MAG: AAA family ATPase [Steroidobacteraceae bacterium]